MVVLGMMVLVVCKILDVVAAAGCVAILLV